MLALTPIKESQGTAVPGGGDTADSVTLSEQFSPLCEKAVRRDGTIGIKIIAPGWGSSGYYGREMLERDIPNVFPAGTQMFWNHATVTEEMERPEGDLRNLAAVTVSTPIWLDAGPKGPGMYADAKPFAGYAGAIDEIGEHIGVSIRGLGRHTQGTAEGRDGRIIQELVMGKSVDFVTAPGAGGGIVKVFEAAPNAGKLPAPVTPAERVQAFLAPYGSPHSSEILSFLDEAGRVLSQANEQKLRTALEQLTAVLSLLSNGEGAVQEVPATEADNLEVVDQEVNMNEKELKEALDASQQALAQRDAALAKMQEQLLLREAREFVTDALAKAELPDVTKIRLGRELIANPPTKEGKVDEAELAKRIDTAVNEAKAEIATIQGKTGQITGMGEGLPGGSDGNGYDPAKLAEARKRQDAALASIGYGGKDNGN